jgi:ER membrane protein complex subunit 7
MRLISLLSLPFGHFFLPLLTASASDDGRTPTMSIEGRLQFPNKMPYNITTRITVNHGAYTTYSRLNGNFTIHDVIPGIYLLEVHSPIHHFSQVKCQFKPDAVIEQKPVFSCLEYHFPGALKQPMDVPLVLTALGTYDYFEGKRGFSILSLLKNPMVLMMVVTCGFMYFLPKMMENMDPEERAMMQKQMARQQNPQQMLGEFFGGFSATSSADDPQPPQAATTAEIKSSKSQRKSKK